MAETVCRHHWLIESPNGPTSCGRCKRCGAKRKFRTSSDDRWVVPTKADVRLIACVKREEAVVGRVIREFCQEGYTSLAAYRRNAQREGEL